MIAMSERVYNFQRIFSLKMGFGRREHDSIPYRAMGPVTVEEYESRADRYDKQLKDVYRVDIQGKNTAEKVKTPPEAAGRAIRPAQRRGLRAKGLDKGWNPDS